MEQKLPLQTSIFILIKLNLYFQNKLSSNKLKTTDLCSSSKSQRCLSQRNGVNMKSLSMAQVANGQSTEEIRSRIHLARSAFRTKGRVYQAVVCSILHYSCETWPVRVADERRLEVVDNDSIRRILCERRRGCVPSVEPRRSLCITSIPAQLAQRRLRWFCHGARRPEGEQVKDLLFPHHLARGADELEAS